MLQEPRPLLPCGYPFRLGILFRVSSFFSAAHGVRVYRYGPAGDFWQGRPERRDGAMVRRGDGALLPGPLNQPLWSWSFGGRATEENRLRFLSDTARSPLGYRIFSILRRPPFSDRPLVHLLLRVKTAPASN